MRIATTQNRLLPLAHLQACVVLIFLFIAPSGAVAQVWTILAFDQKDDGREASLADAATLSYRYDKAQDVLWFRLSLYGTPNHQSFGLNIAFDTRGDETAKLNWWGSNKSFRFDKLLTAWVTRGQNGYEGTVGIANVQGVQAKQFNNLVQNNLQISIEGDSIIVGVKRTDVTDRSKMDLIAAVGSKEQWNDDLPNMGQATIDLDAERPKKGLREIDVTRNNLQFSSDYKTLRDNQPPRIVTKGQGKTTLILIPGMYSGETSFESFIARNGAQYKMYLVTPAGLEGTPAPAMPSTSSYSELAWTRRLERDILDLIRQKKLTKPILVAEQQPASIAAMETAIQHPDQIGGVVIAGAALVTSFPSPKDPTRKTPATPEERASLVNEGWAAQWFKYVTPETWNSNDLAAPLLSDTTSIGEKAWRENELTPLAVKIRYLLEYWASDVTQHLDRLHVPVVVLIPGFDEKFLADPANSFAKTSIVGSWENPVFKTKFELVKIANARMLVFDDQPSQADEAIARFVKQISTLKN
jgi:pimeloyl-ACP methyl ester carboxylesterase